MKNGIAFAHTEQEIAACYPVMAELRPHLDAETFVPLVQHLTAVTNFQLAYLADDGIKAVAGIRISEWLARGKYLEIEDLVATSSKRSHGYGSKLFDWIVAYAQANACTQVRLVSRLSRTAAHRFYLRKGMQIEAHYFSMSLGNED